LRGFHARSNEGAKAIMQALFVLFDFKGFFELRGFLILARDLHVGL